MLTYNMDKNSKIPLYMQIYSFIKRDITAGTISDGEKLPSKRKLAEHLNVSVITVENAYSQLISEGYIESREKRGYYVLHVESIEKKANIPEVKREKQNKKDKKYINLSQSSVSKEHFPFSTWSKIIRRILSDKSDALLERQSYKGSQALREAIAKYLRQFKGIDTDAERIIIGSGTEDLYGMLAKALGGNAVIGIENPGYENIAKIYSYNHISYKYIDMDSQGISVDSLKKSGADVLHISPSHHFPSGITTPIGRRTKILNWCYKNPKRYIIEDDYDSEFRFGSKPIPPLYSIDKNERVIYLNTFTKSVSPAIRIGYMVLPEALMEKCDKNLSFLSCSVSALEQLTMAEFINEGYFERHINKMTRVYRIKRDYIISCLKKYFRKSDYKIHEKDSGLHFILELKTEKSDEEIKREALKRMVKIKFLSEYCRENRENDKHMILIAYTGIDEEDIEVGIKLLSQII